MILFFLKQVRMNKTKPNIVHEGKQKESYPSEYDLSDLILNEVVGNGVFSTSVFTNMIVREIICKKMLAKLFLFAFNGTLN